MSNETNKASEEQLTYANVLSPGMWTGLAVLIATFIVYISGMLPSYVPIDQLPRYWGMRADAFNALFRAPTGWGWTSLVGKGDYLNFIGIAILSGLSIACYLAILPILKKKKMTAYLVLAVAEILVLLLAASGVLKSGH